jgi:hypothetical protein
MTLPPRGNGFPEGHPRDTVANVYRRSDRVRNGVISCFPSHVRLLGQDFTRDENGTGPTPS